MKLKIGIIILAAACVGLFIALFATKKSAEAQRKHDTAAILDFSNQLDTAAVNLNDLRQVNLMLTNDLSSLQQVAETLSNNLAATASTLSTTKDSLATAEGQIVNLNGRISDLEAQNKALDERAAELTNRLAELDTLIAATQQKLANSETNNAFLTAELQKQMAQKAELERKFSDLNVLRAQVKKLKDELFVTRRLEWMANGNDPSTPKKGGAVLMQRSPANVSPAAAAAAKISAGTPPAAKTASPYDLNVEVGSDGSVHVIPPATNSAAH
jgi:predicted  nucleic acid-binding Zn-ribbon protein